MSVYSIPKDSRAFIEPLSLDGHTQARIIKHTLRYSYRLHGHSFYEVFVITDGSATHILNGKVRQIRKGDAFFYDPTCVEEIRISPGEELSFYNIAFDGGILSKNLWSQIPMNNFPYIAHLSDEALQSASYIMDSILEYEEGNTLQVNMLTVTGLEWLILSIFGNNKNFRTEAFYNEQIHDAVMYIQNHFTESVTLNEIASVVHYSPGYFSDQFRKVMHVTFQEYLLSLRIYYATVLLKTTDLPVKTIALDSGFQTISYFANVFKRRMGISPGTYREVVDKTAADYI